MDPNSNMPPAPAQGIPPLPNVPQSMSQPIQGQTYEQAPEQPVQAPMPQPIISAPVAPEMPRMGAAHAAEPQPQPMFAATPTPQPMFTPIPPQPMGQVPQQPMFTPIAASQMPSSGKKKRCSS